VAIDDREKEHNDLVPYWIFEFDNCYKIYRYIPALPLSREKIQMDNLRSSLVAYRMILGQPRQEDLMFFLHKRFDDGVDPKELLNFKIDLSPR
jgi:hypothetical protein